MNNAASFNLLKFVEPHPFLNKTKILSITILFVVILLSCYLFQMAYFHHKTKNNPQLAKTIEQQIIAAQPFLQQGEENKLIGVLSSNVLKQTQGFYPEFEALTHIQVKGLWLNDVIIQRNPAFIKMTGVMSSQDKLNELLKQLSEQAAFKNIQFLDVKVTVGTLPDVPEKYQKALQQLKLPPIYHFIIQTTPTNLTRVSQ